MVWLGFADQQRPRRVARTSTLTTRAGIQTWLFPGARSSL